MPVCGHIFSANIPEDLCSIPVRTGKNTALSHAVNYSRLRSHAVDDLRAGVGIDLDVVIFDRGRVCNPVLYADFYGIIQA